VSSRDVQQVTENKELDLMVAPPPPLQSGKLSPGHCGGVSPLKMEGKPTSSISVRRAGYVGAPATQGVNGSLWERKQMITIG
jgi:hypothetical protein